MRGSRNVKEQGRQRPISVPRTRRAIATAAAIGKAPASFDSLFYFFPFFRPGRRSLASIKGGRCLFVPPGRTDERTDGEEVAAVIDRLREPSRRVIQPRTGLERSRRPVDTTRGSSFRLVHASHSSPFLLCLSGHQGRGRYLSTPNLEARLGDPAGVC